jgi:hypothetical protein
VRSRFDAPPDSSLQVTIEHPSDKSKTTMTLLARPKLAPAMKTGPVTLLLLCLAVFALAEEPNSDAVRRGQLKHLGGAVKAYQLIHDGKSPAKLSDLYNEGLAENLSDFVRPGSHKLITLDSEIDEKSDYTLESMPDTKDLLVREKSPGADGKLLGVFADGTIKVLATSSSSGAGAKPNGANIAFGTVLAIILLGGLAAALWAYARRPLSSRQRSFSELLSRVAQAVKQLRAAIGPAGEFLNTARRQGEQMARKMSAAGRKLVSVLKSRPVESHPLPAKKAVESKGVTCTSCKTVNSAPAKFCRSCGASLGASQAAVLRPSGTCKACGKPLKPGAKFCTVCGSHVI